MPVVPVYERLTRDAPRVVAALLGIAIVGQAADIWHSLVAINRPIKPLTLPVAHVRRARLSPAVGMLFGAPPAPAEAVASRLPLILTGVIAHSDPDKAFAILGDSVAHTRLYRVGAELPDAARLVAVCPDRVEIERAGAREFLHLPLRYAVSAERVAASASEPETVIAELATALPASADDSAAQTWVARHVSFESRDPAGRVIGYTLRGGSKRSGIHLGDVLTAVNGTPVTDPAAVAKLLAENADAPARLSLLRDGSQITVTLNLDTL